MARIVVAIELTNGARKQAVCRTGTCAWQSEAFSIVELAQEEARRHRMWHRDQRPVPAAVPDQTIAGLAARTGLSGDVTIASALPQLTWHVTRALEEAGVPTIGALAAWTDEQLLNLPRFGARRLAMLRAALAAQAGDAA